MTHELRCADRPRRGKAASSDDTAEDELDRPSAGLALIFVRLGDCSRNPLPGLRRCASRVAAQRDALAAALRNAANRCRAGYSSYLDQLTPSAASSPPSFLSSRSEPIG